MTDACFLQVQNPAYRLATFFYKQLPRSMPCFMEKDIDRYDVR